MGQIGIIIDIEEARSLTKKFVTVIFFRFIIIEHIEFYFYFLSYLLLVVYGMFYIFLLTQYV